MLIRLFLLLLQLHYVHSYGVDVPYANPTFAPIYGPPPYTNSLNYPYSGYSFTYDNEVVGEPDVKCLEETISISIRTAKSFRGTVYVQGQHGHAHCRQDFASNDLPGASFTVRIGDCAMRRIRQLTPHGVNYLLVFVTNFHPQFVTKIDRSFAVRCFYALADRPVSTDMEVSTLPPSSIEQASVLQPECIYTVRAGSPDGPIHRHISVGDHIVHRWECKKLRSQNFGMLVKSCNMIDQTGVSIPVIDDRGCPMETPAIQRNIQYDDTLSVAFVDAIAIQLPDRDRLSIMCQISFCNIDHGECGGVTPPNCPTISRANYHPNAMLNPDVYPTQVIGSYDPSQDPGVRDAMFRYPYERRKEETPEQDIKEERSENATSSEVFTTSRRLVNPTEAPSTTTVTETITPTTSTPMTTILSRATTTYFMRNEPIPQATVAAQADTPTLQVFSQRTPIKISGSGAKQFEKRLRDDVLPMVDVIADLQFVSEADAKMYAPLTEAIIPESVICVNKVAGISFFAVFSITGIICLSMLTYFLKDFYKQCWAKDIVEDRVCTPSTTTSATTSSTSSSSSTTNPSPTPPSTWASFVPASRNTRNNNRPSISPVYTRKLGQPGYSGPYLT